MPPCLTACATSLTILDLGGNAELAVTEGAVEGILLQLPRLHHLGLWGTATPPEPLAYLEDRAPWLDVRTTPPRAQQLVFSVQ